MRLSAFLTLAGLIALVFGVAFLLAPVQTLAQYGVEANPGLVLMSRFFGAALVQLGILQYMARPIEDAVGRRAIVIAGVFGSILTTVVALSAQMAHLVNNLGWLTVAIGVILFVGYASNMRA
jgi:FtsH-binding integral membrane protein